MRLVYSTARDAFNRNSNNCIVFTMFKSKPQKPQDGEATIDLSGVVNLGLVVQQLAAREAANCVVLRALLATHPNKDAAEKYAVRMSAYSLSQPGFILNPENASHFKAALAFLLEPERSL